MELQVRLVLNSKFPNFCSDISPGRFFFINESFYQPSDLQGQKWATQTHIITSKPLSRHDEKSRPIKNITYVGLDQLAIITTGLHYSQLLYIYIYIYIYADIYAANHQPPIIPTRRYYAAYSIRHHFARSFDRVMAETAL